jgi:hypothetical protein
MSTTTPGRKRSTLKMVLAGVAVLGVGAAITTAVWTDDVFFSATATASSFDLQGSAAAAGPWSDVGVPGDEAVIAITAAGLDALSPSTTVDVPFYLCNIGTTAGTVTAITTPAIADPLGAAAGATLTATVTTPLVGAALPSDPTCATPVVGTLHVVTTAAFPSAAQGLSGAITFTVTGTSS